MTTPFSPEDDYPDPRGDQQRQVDSAGSDAQSAALTDSGMNPHAYINEMIERIREARLGLADLGLEDPPLQFDVWSDPPPRDPGQPDMGIVILVARGELLLRVPGPGAPSPDEAAGPRGDADTGGTPPAWQQAHDQLLERGYEQVGPEIPVAAPLRRYVAARSPRELVADRDEIRAATGAEVDLNYVATAGHVVKADDYPRGTAAHRCYSPHWIRCHRVTRDITVAVIDTGINNLSRTDGWLTGIPEIPANIDPLDVFPVTVQNGQIVRGDGLLDLAAGHGSFVTGVVEQVAPAATIRVYRAVDTQGMGTSYDVANAMVQAARDGADILHLSLGLMTVDNQAPVAFTTAVQTIRSERTGVVIVASAGNMGLQAPMYPAAMPEVTGVAALNADLLNPTRAPWSNYGDWVDCAAVGVGITSTFVEGYEPHIENGQVVTEYFGRNSWAYWSGTSFSAPQISGAVAQLCQLNDVDPPVALGQLLNGRPTLPGCGYVVPILPGS
jgi:thermitase